MKAYIVWVPILRLDDRSWAVRGAKQYSDARVTYFWDGNGATTKTWQGLLGLKVAAWDFYALYPAHESWGKVLTKPAYWMHELSGIGDVAPVFDRPVLESKTKEFLALVHN